jgi:hypothetical protein
MMFALNCGRCSQVAVLFRAAPAGAIANLLLVEPYAQ